ncbi:MAG: DUF484 family protein [Rhodobacteraceae bacterium]|jgi:uncharacterized protein YigA (DUF484 family)|nr:DUF484 family protein [Paracoccaceae bacterium]MBL4556390.1 DUF484 family protein [Paracoccaceae bacterium]HBG97574.1 DUF484 domain-containing protein [Paracoccaceae bacterium]
MSSAEDAAGRLRDKVLADPALILDDVEVMKALVAADEGRRGKNVVDLRAAAMERLEARLARLESTYNSVVSAAYDNVAGMQQIHRAVLTALDPAERDAFFAALTGPLVAQLSADVLRLLLTRGDVTGPEPLAEAVLATPPGWIDRYLGAGRNRTARGVTLRALATGGEAAIYGKPAAALRSEAALKLDFGPGCGAGLLLLGARDPDQFRPDHGTDLLGFFAAVFERAARPFVR